ncbi:DUF4239 domain-containing protein [Deinococcus pimensis]|uniref:bestrophin-like domain n=1 Tax=Deinococcus pimensis TaxID=309888 RepID=UPI0004821C59|nr:DUF4239 domain-containing protein [Deinococcus pimensis]
MLTAVLCVLVVVVIVTLSLLGMLSLRRFVTLARLEEHNQVAGFIYAVVGVCSSVLLTFVVVAVWQQQVDVHARVEQETNDLVGLYRDAQAFAPETRSMLRADLRAYALSVLNAEWPALASGRRSPATERRFTTLVCRYQHVRPTSTAEEAWYRTTLDRLTRLEDNRRLRLMSAASTIPPLMWSVLWLTSAVTIAFSFFFGTRNVAAQALMVGALSGTIALILFLAVALDRPFGGPIQVQPSGFRAFVDATVNQGDVMPRPCGSQ